MIERKVDILNNLIATKRNITQFKIINPMLFKIDARGMSYLHVVSSQKFRKSRLASIYRL